MNSYIATIQQFVLSLVVLLKHPATPAHARKWFDEAAQEVANHQGREADETLADALFRVFGVAPPSKRAIVEAAPAPKTLPQLYLALAEALALVMQHPETPRDFVRQFKKDAQRINKLAGITPEYLAANIEPEGIAAQSAFLQLGLTLADVLERDDVPDDIWNWLGDTTNSIEDLLAPENSLKREAARLRGVLTFYANERTAAPDAAGTTYAPEIEARRADYQQLAEAFITMTMLESERAPSLLDLDGPDANINDTHLSKALHHHLYALLLHMNWWDARTMRKFYAEARLWGDQQQWELEQELAQNERAA